MNNLRSKKKSEHKPGKKIEAEVIVSTTYLARFFETEPKILIDWEKAGMPKHSRGKWDIKKCFDWYMQEKIGKDDESGTHKSKLLYETMLRKEQARHKKAQADIEEQKVAELKKRLIPVETVREEYAERLLSWMAAYYERGIRLAPLLENKSREEILRIIERYDIETIARFKKTGQFIKLPLQENEKLIIKQCYEDALAELFS